MPADFTGRSDFKVTLGAKAMQSLDRKAKTKATPGANAEV
jgi:hypothetical protein